MHTLAKPATLLGMIGASALMLAGCTPPASSTQAATTPVAPPAAFSALNAQEAQAQRLLAEAKRDMATGRMTDANRDLDSADAIFRSDRAYSSMLQRTANARRYMAAGDVDSAGHELDAAADQLRGHHRGRGG